MTPPARDSYVETSGLPGAPGRPESSRLPPESARPRSASAPPRQRARLLPRPSDLAIRVRRAGAFGVDAAAWTIGIGTAWSVNSVGSVGSGPGGGGALLLGLALVLQAALGLAGGLYRRRRYGSVDEMTVAVLAFLGVTVVLAVTLVLGLVPGMAPGWVGPFLAGGAVAVVLASSVRLFRRAIGIRERWARKERDPRWPLEVALPLAERIASDLERCDAVIRCSPVGSVRRMSQTVGDIEIAAASDRPDEVVEAFLAVVRPRVHEVSSGDRLRKVSGIGAEGIKVSLKIVPPGAWGAALQYLTGSLQHNRRLRLRALRRGVRFAWGPHPLVRYYSVTDRVTTTLSLRSSAMETEEDVYQRLELPWIHPCLRRNGEEVDAAIGGCLPRSVSMDDVRGLLHRPAAEEDGEALAAILAAAADRGYEYLVVVDGERTLESVGRRRALVREIECASNNRIRLLHAIELPVREDGSLPLPEGFLARFDFVLGTAAPERLLQAIRHPRVRIVRVRAGSGSDIADDALRAAARRGVAIEVAPHLAPLPPELVRHAIGMGVRLVLSNSASPAGPFDGMRYAVAMAQRGWAEAPQVVNTWEWEAFERLARGPRARILEANG